MAQPRANLARPTTRKHRACILPAPRISWAKAEWLRRITMGRTHGDTSSRVTRPHAMLPGQWVSRWRASGSRVAKLNRMNATHRVR